MQAISFGYNIKNTETRVKSLQNGAKSMVRLRILEILAEQNRTKYWLYKRMEISYQNFNRMVNNETASIRFDNLEKLSNLLECPIGDLFEKISDEDSSKHN